MATIADWNNWRSQRQQSVAQFQGDLALVGLHTINEPTRVKGIPGLWTPLNAGYPGLVLTASPADGILVDGQLLDGTAKLEIDRTLVRFSDTLTAVATAQPGSEHLLALYDASSEAIGRYESITAYSYNPEWVIEAEFVRNANDQHRTVDFTHNSDRDGVVRQHQSPGDIRFVREGRAYELSPFASDDSLIIVFGDKTNGKETYGMGRMVLVSPEIDGKVFVDFNQSFLPPCAFSYHFNCPLPPAHNRLPFEVAAGEKQVILRE
ncbi:DUF1684 domain-containing protein [Cohnella sp. WQ 127256]|uniref:DUF1684 domain-containing protein n=1 Tax=Cohnella sp. WQ 127256 TaxID=2938790 RepID=UPI0021198423|nr:DUF1684 domain-containing protein [Cohnella sp. WQ 127256]